MRLSRITGSFPIRFAALLLAGGALLAAGGPVSAAPLFVEATSAEFGEPGYPATSLYFTMSLDEMRSALQNAPVENFDAPQPGLELALPLPTGGSERFAVWESSILHPELAARYPEIKTYVGRGLDDGTATVRLDTTPAGFHALILSTRRTMLIDPVSVGDNGRYVSYFKRSPAEVPSASRAFSCDLQSTPEGEREIQALVESRALRGLRSTGPELRTYRLACAATGEYTSYHGGTVALGLAAITTSVNRVTGIYEREVSVRMELVPNNDLLVYTNGGTDPYTNNNGFTMLGQNQSNITSVIGTSNYDIGHVFSTGGGGVAGLGVVCVNSQKARGVTGLSIPIGDIFDVDFVAHEMGHQYGATHTFNGTAGSCGGSNRTGSTAYEPGSGSTIMAYAGICGSHNVANNSQDYFQGASFDQISAFTRSGSGSICAATTSTGNDPPVPVAGNTGLTIPINTPFILAGSATDPNGDDVTYCWEEFDLGPAGPPNQPSGNAPIFRSRRPKTQNFRMFPKANSVKNNTVQLGEILPSYGRTMNFRLTVRDNLGGVDFDATSVVVDGNSGPFLVTSIGATPWNGGEVRTITWDVAGTDGAPVSCSSVNILLALDGGDDFSEVLVAGTPNDGNEVITVPNTATTTARVKIEAVGNIFFDLNNDDFEVIGGAVGVNELASAAEALTLTVRPNPFTNQTGIEFAVSRPGPVRVSIYDAAGRRVIQLLDAVRSAGTHRTEWNGVDATGSPVASGVYFVRMESSDATRISRLVRLK